MSRPRVTGPTVPAARWARRPLTGHGLESQLDVTAVNDFFTVISHKYIGRYGIMFFMCLAPSFLPSRAGAVTRIRESKHGRENQNESFTPN